jgi:hypothetical protein
MYSLFNNVSGFKPDVTSYLDFWEIKQFVTNQTVHNSLSLVSTLALDEQECLIAKTLSAEKEVMTIQSFQERFQMKNRIVIYGRNNIDPTVETKFKQLRNLGFTDVAIYKGGMFEWALLQEIYGVGEFPTTSVIRDPLKWGRGGGGGGGGGGGTSCVATTNKDWNNLLTYFP